MNKQLNTFFVDPFKLIDIEALVEQAVRKNEERILDLNRAQLDRGIDAKGKSLGRYRNFKYKNRFEPVDLKLTGDFRKKFTLTKKGKKQAEIFSLDDKAAKLEKRYGKDIHGLTSTNIGIAGDIIKPDLQDGFRMKLYKR